MRRSRWLLGFGLCALALSSGCNAGENAVLMTVRTQQDVRDLTMTVLSLDVSHPRYVGSSRTVGMSAMHIDTVEPIRLAVQLPFPANVLVQVHATTPTGMHLVATRCYDVHGVIEDHNVMLVGPIDGSDADGDGFVPDPQTVCRDFGGGDPITGAVPCANACPASRAADCAPTDPMIYPGAPNTICNDGIDQNCDGHDEPCGDADGDGYNACSIVPSAECDCDDTVATIHPHAADVCGDGVDQDCNGTDAACDRDGDGVPGSAPVGGTPDCDDTRADVHPAYTTPSGMHIPAAPEICDGLDNDCNFYVDELPMCLGNDIDADGSETCPPGGGTNCDCNDCNASIRPGRTEVCGDGVDQDCDGVDVACPANDADRDSYPVGRDCDDNDRWIFPGSTSPDRCGDMIATDCLPGDDTSCATDADHDGYTEPPECENNAAINPSVMEVCDAIDNDCDHITDDLTPVMPSAQYPYGTNGCRFISTTMPPSAMAIDFTRDVQNCGGCRLACDMVTANQCVAGVCDCAGDPGVATCPAGRTCCTSGCADLMTDPQNCGGCDQHCGPGEACSGGHCTCAGVVAAAGEACVGGTPDCCTGGCTDLTNNSDNCGRCGNPCTLANATPHCVAGACAADMCTGSHADCDGRPDTGCEIDLSGDPMNCGRCGVHCGGSLETCSGGVCRCGVTSGTGFGEACPGASNVCCNNTDCHDLTSDVNHCGACNAPCGANQGCGPTGCFCTGSFLDCPGDGSGCGTASDTSNCHACGNACGNNESCGGSGCACGGTSSPSGHACTGANGCCGSSCVNLGGTSNCRSCGNACGTNESCGGSGCACGSTTALVGAACTGGTTCCAGAPSTCTNTSGSDSNNCGGCNMRCGTGEHCAAGHCVCGATTAASGEACPGMANVCCGDSVCSGLTDHDHCGSCTAVCGTNETCNASGVCHCGASQGTSGSGPACGMSSACCASGDTNCTDLTTNSNCGMCGRRCGTSATCNGGVDCECTGGPTVTCYAPHMCSADGMSCP